MLKDIVVTADVMDKETGSLKCLEESV